MFLRDAYSLFFPNNSYWGFEYLGDTSSYWAENGTIICRIAAENLVQWSICIYINIKKVIIPKYILISSMARIYFSTQTTTTTIIIMII